MEEKKSKKATTSFANKIREGKKRNDGYEETRHCFNKLKSGIKGSGKLKIPFFIIIVDHKKPETYPIINRIKKNKNKNTYEEEEHLK